MAARSPSSAWRFLLHFTPRDRSSRAGPDQPEVLGGILPPIRDIGNVLYSQDLRREDPPESGQKTIRIVACPALQPALKDSPMYVLRAFAFLLFLAQVVLAEQPTPILPDPKLTTGDTFDVTAHDVCVPAYAKKVRAVPAWLRRQAYVEYGITQYKTGDYEVDHLIPLSLGGSNSIRNLWPQSTKTSPCNSYVEDALERKLHKLVPANWTSRPRKAR